MLRYLAMITETQTMPVDETVKLSVDGYREAEKVIKNKTLRWNHVTENDLGLEIVTHFDITGPLSTMGLIKELDSSRYAVLGLVVNMRDGYSDQHYEFLKLLYDPLAGVTYHVLTQLEMANLKERLIVENQELKKRLGYFSDSGIIGIDTGLRYVIDQVEQVAPLDSPVLLLGETGVGKEVMAKEIHRRSKRAKGPLVSINCGAIPETLLDSELFGYEKGAFTGAHNLKRGYFEQADGGTVFLDEIGELAVQAQVRLLRLLQTMEFQRVGGSRTLAIDVRIIAATNRDLASLVAKQQFRKDLWFRINVFPIQIPPLRARKEDIQALAEYFTRQKSKEMNFPVDPVFAPGAMVQLRAYDWPGNVRELQNVIERALITSQGRPLSFRNLAALPSEKPDEGTLDEPGRFLKMNEMIALHIRRSLSLSKGRIAGHGRAAEILGMNPSTLRARMHKLGIRVDRLPS
jgi:transcriptional regulator with GAF, ATPase, and Fis domain